MVGSPPCMRGKAVAGTGDGCAVRITPAHAGKSGAVWALAVPAEGSPPRMRGEAPCRATTPVWGGITPAHAGKRSNGTDVIYTALGSPPRMRREEETGRPWSGIKGITPAHAGRRQCPQTAAPQQTDHPRACGEKDLRVGHASHPQGSPPRMRGEVSNAPSSTAAAGITPAHAGRSGAD